MICGMPAVSFVIMFIVWPLIPIASIVCGIKMDKDGQNEQK